MIGNGVPASLPVELPTYSPRARPTDTGDGRLAGATAHGGTNPAGRLGMVRQGVLVERRLPAAGLPKPLARNGAGGLLLAVVVSGMAALEPEALPDFLLLVTLATAIYALFTRQSYSEHDRLLGQLRPFVASLASRHTSWLTPEPEEVEQSVAALFTSLCRDVLGASHGRLSLTAGRLHRTFTYTAAKMSTVATARRT